MVGAGPPSPTLLLPGSHHPQTEGRLHAPTLGRQRRGLTCSLGALPTSTFHWGGPFKPLRGGRPRQRPHCLPAQLHAHSCHGRLCPISPTSELTRSIWFNPSMTLEAGLWSSALEAWKGDRAWPGLTREVQKGLNFPGPLWMRSGRWALGAATAALGSGGSWAWMLLCGGA